MTEATTAILEADPPKPSGDVSFGGNRKALAGILVRCFLLMLVTLGIYRFWATTHIRRFFWGNVRIRGEALEYTGRATELLIGFLIAMVVLAPVMAAYNIIPFLTSDFGVIVVIQGGIAIGFLFLFQIAVYRARRYRLSRTLWRGIRFGQDGSSLAYALRAFGYGLLNVITLGIAVPWSDVALMRYKMIHTRFGRQHFVFDARGRGLVRAWAPVLGCILLFVGAAFAAPLLPWGPVSGGSPFSGGGVFVLVAIALVGAGFYVRYRVHQFRYFVEATGLAGLRLRSTLSTAKVGFVILLYLFLLVCIAGVLGLLVVGIVYTLGPTLMRSTPSMLLLFFVLFITAACAGWIAKIAMFYWELLGFVCDSLETENLEAVQSILQDSGDAPRHGEGLLVALDGGGL